MTAGAVAGTELHDTIANNCNALKHARRLKALTCSDETERIGWNHDRLARNLESRL